MAELQTTDALVDPAVSRAKFDRELAEYRRLEDEHIRRGWWMLKAEFPEVLVAFATPQIKPPSVLFGALLDFSNYDYWPPSVRLVNPFTRKPYPYKELPTKLPRRIEGPGVIPPHLAAQGIIALEQPLMMSHTPDSPDDVPFLCLPGVREYHQHPAHSADDWLLHRGGSEGTLYFILEKLYQYGVVPITGYEAQLQIAYQFGNVGP